VTHADPRPPRLARWLLRLRPLGSRRSEIDADLQEAFAARVTRAGRRRAAVRYYVDVLSVWRWNPSGGRMMRDLIQDLMYGLRVFRRNPGAVATTIAGLALAIGVSTAVFSLLNATLWFRPGVPDPDSAVRVERAWQGGVSHGWPYADFLALREMSRDVRLEATTIVPEMPMFSTTAPTLDRDDSRRVRASVVSGGYMTTFGARPLHGRVLMPGDDVTGAQPVAVVGYTFWNRRLDSDPSVVGRVVWVNGKPVTIVGVTERRFTGLTEEPPALWMSFAGMHGFGYGYVPSSSTSRTSVSVVARMAAGSTIAHREGQVGAMAAALGSASVDKYRTTGAKLVPASQRPGEKGTGLIVALILSAIGLVVLLACVNVANLQLASAFARQREIGVRLALGASKARIVRQLVTESIALGWVAGAMGLAFAIWLVPVLARLVGVPITYDLGPDARVFTFLLVVSCAAGIGAGLAPARYGARGNLLTSLKGDGPRVGRSGRPSRLRASLIGVQAAASLVLLVIASLAVRAAIRATQIDLGFDASRLIAVSGNPGRDDAAKAYLDVAIERVRAVPGVAAVSLAAAPPFSGGFIRMDFERGAEAHRTSLNRTSADYFSTVGLRIVRGRAYTEAEVAADAPVALVSETLARRLWGSAEPLGQVLDDFKIIDKAPRVTVIGVVSDAVTARLQEIRTAAVYRPLTQLRFARMVVRSEGPPEAVLPALRAALLPIDPRLRPEITPVRDGVQRELETPRSFATIAAYVAALALTLAIIGIYGVTTFVTGQRTREIGLRIAVGASRTDVVRLLLRDSLRTVVLGLGGGVVVALIASRFFTGALYGVTALDPIAFAAASITLLVSAALAAYVPTRRAARVDPVVVLRQS
jgi:putative ABC transport system permease protein